MDLTDIFRVLQVALGIGLVIFVHEAGHFIAARLCKVQVEVFSLGFGPALLSWKHRGTVYQIAAVPVGGFVKMLGDEPTQEGRIYARENDRKESDKRESKEAFRGSELSSKSIGQRFFIYSGGVLMNLAFAVVVFPILFSAGVQFTKPLIEPVPGGVAWRAGIKPGSTVESIEGRPVFEFGHIQTAVALGDPAHIEMMVKAPGEETARRFVVASEYVEQWGINMIGVDVGTEPGTPIEVLKDSPAWQAGLRSGMELIGVEGLSTALSPFEQLVVSATRGGEIPVIVRDQAGVRTCRVQPTTSNVEGPPRLGIGAPANRIIGLRENPDAVAIGLRKGDKLRTVNGRPIYRLGDFADALVESSDDLVLEIERDKQYLELGLPEGSAPLNRERRLALYSDIALGGDRGSPEVIVTPDEAAYEAGMRDGDVITHLDGIKVDNWNVIFDLVGSAGERGSAIAINLNRNRGEAPGFLELTATPRAFFAPEIGFGPRQPEYIYSVSDPMEAIRVGVDCSIKFVEDTILTLKRILIGQVSGKNMGGIITISKISYSVSEQGLTKLFFFLCMLSINLAILNVLPIPVLDGGHLFFLLIEKLKGSPVSDRVLGYSQMVGMVLILSLMVYITYNDIQRLFQ